MGRGGRAPGRLGLARQARRRSDRRPDPSRRRDRRDRADRAGRGPSAGRAGRVDPQPDPAGAGGCVQPVVGPGPGDPRRHPGARTCRGARLGRPARRPPARGLAAGRGGARRVAAPDLALPGSRRAARARPERSRARRRRGVPAVRRHRARAADRRCRRSHPPHRGLGSRALSRRPVDPDRRRRRHPGFELRGPRSIRRGLPPVGAHREPVTARAALPVANVGARATDRSAVRRGRRTVRVGRDAQLDRAGQPVPGAARQRARLVPLPPPVPGDAPGRARAA